MLDVHGRNAWCAGRSLNCPASFPKADRAAQMRMNAQRTALLIAMRRADTARGRSPNPQSLFTSEPARASNTAAPQHPGCRTCGKRPPSPRMDKKSRSRRKYPVYSVYANGYPGLLLPRAPRWRNHTAINLRKGRRLSTFCPFEASGTDRSEHASKIRCIKPAQFTPNHAYDSRGPTDATTRGHAYGSMEPACDNGSPARPQRGLRRVAIRPYT